MGSTLTDQNSVGKATASQISDHAPDQTSQQITIFSKRPRPDSLAELPEAKRQQMNEGPSNAIRRASHSLTDQNSAGQANVSPTSDHAPDQTSNQTAIFSKRPRPDSLTELPETKRQQMNEGPAKVIYRAHQHSRKKLKQPAQGDARSSSSKEEVIKTPSNYTPLYAASESSSTSVTNEQETNLSELPTEMWLECLSYLLRPDLDNFLWTCRRGRSLVDKININLLDPYLKYKTRDFLSLSSRNKKYFLEGNFISLNIIKNIYNINNSFFNSRDAVIISKEFFTEIGKNFKIDEQIIFYTSMFHKNYNVLEIRKLYSEKNISIYGLISAGFLHVNSNQEKEEFSQLLSEDHKGWILRFLPLACFQKEEIDIKAFLKIPPENIRKGIIQTYEESLTDPTQKYNLKLMLKSHAFMHDELYASHEGEVHPLLELLNEEHIDFFKKLIKLGFNPNCPNKNIKSSWQGLLHLAISSNFYQIAYFLIKESQIDINSKNLYGKTPLNIAFEKKTDLEVAYINEVIKFAEMFNIDLQEPPIDIEKYIKSNLTKIYKDTLKIIKYYKNLDSDLYYEAIEKKICLEKIYTNTLKHIEIYNKNNRLINLLKKHPNIN